MAKREKSLEVLVASCSKRKNRKKRLMKDPVPYLPREIISNILHWLPAECLYDSGRYVCKTWAELLHTPSFMHAHLIRNSVGGIIIFNPFRVPKMVRYISIKEWKMEETLLCPEFVPLRHKICGSTDGILLISGGGESYVANPLTRKMLKLPRLPSAGVGYRFHEIASVPRICVLKVVSIVKLLDETLSLHVLTLGDMNMAWRKLTFASSECKLESCGFAEKSLSVDGVIYIYLMERRTTQPAHCSILAIDLHDESTHYLKAPSINDFRMWEWTIVQMWKTVCCVSTVGDDGLMKVLMLKDLRKNEWVIRESINVFEHPGSKFLPRCGLRLYLWLEHQHIMVLGGYVEETRLYKLVAFCLKTGRILVLEEFSFFFLGVFHHIPSLVWF